MEPVSQNYMNDSALDLSKSKTGHYNKRTEFAMHKNTCNMTVESNLNGKDLNGLTPSGYNNHKEEMSSKGITKRTPGEAYSLLRFLQKACIRYVQEEQDDMEAITDMDHSTENSEDDSAKELANNTVMTIVPKKISKEVQEKKEEINGKEEIDSIMAASTEHEGMSSSMGFNEMYPLDLSHKSFPVPENISKFSINRTKPSYTNEEMNHTKKEMTVTTQDTCTPRTQYLQNNVDCVLQSKDNMIPNMYKSGVKTTQELEVDNNDIMFKYKDHIFANDDGVKINQEIIPIKLNSVFMNKAYSLPYIPAKAVTTGMIPDYIDSVVNKSDCIITSINNKSGKLQRIVHSNQTNDGYLLSNDREIEHVDERKLGTMISNEVAYTQNTHAKCEGPGDELVLYSSDSMEKEHCLQNIHVNNFRQISEIKADLDVLPHTQSDCASPTIEKESNDLNSTSKNQNIKSTEKYNESTCENFSEYLTSQRKHAEILQKCNGTIYTTVPNQNTKESSIETNVMNRAFIDANFPLVQHSEVLHTCKNSSGNISGKINQNFVDAPGVIVTSDVASCVTHSPTIQQNELLQEANWTKDFIYKSSGCVYKPSEHDMYSKCNGIKTSLECETKDQFKSCSTPPTNYAYDNKACKLYPTLPICDTKGNLTSTPYPKELFVSSRFASEGSLDQPFINVTPLAEFSSATKEVDCNQNLVKVKEEVIDISDSSGEESNQEPAIEIKKEKDSNDMKIREKHFTWYQAPNSPRPSCGNSDPLPTESNQVAEKRAIGKKNVSPSQSCPFLRSMLRPSYQRFSRIPVTTRFNNLANMCSDVPLLSQTYNRNVSNGRAEHLEGAERSLIQVPCRTSFDQLLRESIDPSNGMSPVNKDQTVWQSKERSLPGYGPQLHRVRNLFQGAASMRHSQKSSKSGPSTQTVLCSICGSTFAGFSYLKVHMRQHTGEKPYKCTKCGKQFAYPGSLTRHIRIHSGLKPYKCEFCGMKFTHRETQIEHRRRHTKERPFMCDICGVTFMRRANLRQHMSIHTGVKPYSCNVCSSAFARAEHLNRHVKSHHKDNDHQQI